MEKGVIMLIWAENHEVKILNNLNINLYSLLRVIVLKFQKDLVEFHLVWHDEF